MGLDFLTNTLTAWMEGLRSWVLQQGWLVFAHHWMTSADVSTIWAIVVLAVFVVVVVVGFAWPVRKAAPPRRETID